MSRVLCILLFMRINRWLLRCIRSCHRSRRIRHRGTPGRRNSRRPEIRNPKRHRGSRQDIAGYIHYRWSLKHNCNHSSQSSRCSFHRSLHRIHRNHSHNRFRSHNRHNHNRSLRRNYNLKNNFFCSFEASLDNFHTVRYDEKAQNVTKSLALNIPL